MIGKAPQCYQCQHFRRFNENGDPVCLAFPDGIPEEIFFDAEDHISPWPGQENNLVFKEK